MASRRMVEIGATWIKSNSLGRNALIVALRMVPATAHGHMGSALSGSIEVPETIGSGDDDLRSTMSRAGLSCRHS